MMRIFLVITLIFTNFLAAQDWKELGFKALKSNDNQNAILYYNKAIKLDPEDDNSFTNRALAYSKLKDYDNAINDFTYALSMKPSDPVIAYNSRGLAYYKLKQYEKAIDDHTNALKFNPKHRIAYYNRGLALKKLKRHNEAVKDYSKAIELGLKTAPVYYSRALAYRQLHKKKESSDDFNEYLKLNGNKDGDAEEIREQIKALGFEPKY
ncbi:MAG: tetratricopeptide repeat protein [Candidatus Delongbacteria bacterium]|nr:tetratricopeptide repeat protein [Candidatus Delongbacteria bacterium]